MTKRRDVLKGIGSGAAVIAMGGVGVASADDDEGDGEAGLRVAHASPNAPNVDVYVDSDKVLSAVPFRAVSDYQELEAGTYQVKITAADDPDTVVYDKELTLDSEDYTAVARGELGEETDTSFDVDVFEDTNGANIGDDESRVRAIHASPDAPAVDVTVNDGALLFDGVKRFTSSGYAVVSAGTYDVEIRPDTEDNSGEIKFTKEVTLVGGSTYTAFAVGYLDPENAPSDEEFGLVAVQDKSAPPRGDEDDDDDEEDEDDDGNGDDNGRGRGRGDE